MAASQDFGHPFVQPTLFGVEVRRAGDRGSGVLT
jgi:hypothetical protein